MNNTREGIDKNWESVRQVNRNWHTFWMAPWLICCFTAILLHIERKWLLQENLATILPLKPKLSGKFQHFNANDGSIETLKIVEFPKILKHFRVPNSDLPKGNYAAPPPPPPYQIKTSYVSGTKIFERRCTEIYRHLLYKCSKNAVLGRLEMVQCKCFFSDTNQKHVFSCVMRVYFLQYWVSWGS